MAQVIEWLSIIRVEQLAVAGVKRASLPKVHRVSRPGETTDETEVTMSPRDFAVATAA